LKRLGQENCTKVLMGWTAPASGIGVPIVAVVEVHSQGSRPP
jgi:hypothetical protein